MKMKEMDTMALMTKKLIRDLAKLEALKQQILQSLNDNSTSGETAVVEKYDRSVSRGYATTALPPHADFKELFHQTRSRLSYEQFRAFVANIRERNAQRQSQEETMRKLEEIFGIDNKDLHLSFQRMFDRSSR